MSTTKDLVERHLRPLIGRKLSIARRAADMLVLHFGDVTAVDEGTVGELAVHIQCPWRIEGPGGVFTGRTDLWEPADQDADVHHETWDYDESENLQDRRIGALLGGYDPSTRSFTNNGGLLQVEAVEGDEVGGAALRLSGGYRLAIFPAGSVGEDWRVFQPRSGKHFVVSGGKVEEVASDDLGE